MNASHRDPFLITGFSIIVLVTPVLTYFCTCRLLCIGMRGDVDVGREKLILTINTAILIVLAVCRHCLAFTCTNPFKSHNSPVKYILLSTSYCCTEKLSILPKVIQSVIELGFQPGPGFSTLSTSVPSTL